MTGKTFLIDDIISIKNNYDLTNDKRKRDGGDDDNPNEGQEETEENKNNPNEGQEETQGNKKNGNSTNTENGTKQAGPPNKGSGKVQTINEQDKSVNATSTEGSFYPIPSSVTSASPNPTISNKDHGNNYLKWIIPSISFAFILSIVFLLVIRRRKRNKNNSEDNGIEYDLANVKEVKASSSDLDNIEGITQNSELIHQDITYGSEVNSNSLSQSQSLDLLNINQSAPNINTIETQDIIDSKLNNKFFNSPILQNPQMQNPQMQNPQMQNPQMQNPQMQNPQMRNPQMQNPQMHYPTIQYPPNQNQNSQMQNHLNQYPTMQYYPNQSQNPQMQNYQKQYPIMQYLSNQSQNTQIQNHLMQSPPVPINYNNINGNNYNSSALENNVNGNIPSNNFTNINFKQCIGENNNKNS